MINEVFAFKVDVHHGQVRAMVRTGDAGGTVPHVFVMNAATALELSGALEAAAQKVAPASPQAHEIEPPSGTGSAPDDGAPWL